MPEATMRTFEFMPLSIRLDTLGGLATPLVLRGTPLPTSRSDVFNTAADNQSSVLVNLVMGESPLTSNDIPLGKVLLQGIPPAPKGQRQIKV